MSKEPKAKEPTTKEAVEFAQSLRGKYIIGQALAIASDTLVNAKHPEFSNIADMEFLGNSLFQIGFIPTKTFKGGEIDEGWKIKEEEMAERLKEIGGEK